MDLLRSNEVSSESVGGEVETVLRKDNLYAYKASLRGS